MHNPQHDWTALPRPRDDGAALHLHGARIAAIVLAATDGSHIDLSRLAGRTVLYVYPMTGARDGAVPDGWDAIPGARGCTPQACSFRDHFAELAKLGVDQLFGLSVQGTEYQREAAERLHLPFPLLSDQKLEFAAAMRLPTFKAAGQTLLKRLSMILWEGRIEQVFYPVFPPDRNVHDIVEWLAANPRVRGISGSS